MCSAVQYSAQPTQPQHHTTPHTLLGSSLYFSIRSAYSCRLAVSVAAHVVVSVGSNPSNTRHMTPRIRAISAVD